MHWAMAAGMILLFHCFFLISALGLLVAACCRFTFEPSQWVFIRLFIVRMLQSWTSIYRACGP